MAQGLPLLRMLCFVTAMAKSIYCDIYHLDISSNSKRKEEERGKEERENMGRAKNLICHLITDAVFTKLHKKIN